MPPTRTRDTQRTARAAAPGGQCNTRVHPEDVSSVGARSAKEHRRAQWRTRNASRRERQGPLAALASQIALHTRWKPAPFQPSSTVACAIITVLPAYSDVPTSDITPSMLSVERLDQPLAEGSCDFPGPAWSAVTPCLRPITPSGNWGIRKLRELFERVQFDIPEPSFDTQTALTGRAWLPTIGTSRIGTQSGVQSANPARLSAWPTGLVGVAVAVWKLDSLQSAR